VQITGVVAFAVPAFLLHLPFCPSELERSMHKARNLKLSAAILTASLLSAGLSAAQSAPPATGPGVGAVAPTFSLPGATRYGLLRDPVNLADYRGKVVVLAFFFKARTKG
jgi:hypothetical protein